ncbi:MAG: dipeptide epimerase [Bacteroidales bacterium]
MLTKQIKLTFAPYDLLLKHTFTIAGSTRVMTPAVMTKIEYDGYVGYGEASMPPYLGETQSSCMDFLSRVKLDRFSSPFLLEDILTYVDSLEAGNCAAKASVDIALHDLVGKMLGAPWYRIWGLNPKRAPKTSYTIGMDTPEVVRKKTLEAPFDILKVKLGGDNDRVLIETIRSVSNKPICVDANQGWKDKYEALDMVQWLSHQGVSFIEQPMPKSEVESIAWLTQHSCLPIVADESLQRLSDLERLKGVFSGVNIKLMKCTGMREAHRMVNLARSFDMNVMIGCMTESSCAISAAAQLSPACDWADLDGNELISNDCFDGVRVINGNIVLSELPGIGALPI